MESLLAALIRRMLIGIKGEATYPLYDNFVQLGSVHFSITSDQGKPGIVMLETWHSDHFIHHYHYNPDEKVFVKETFYQKMNINQQYNQSASYAFFNDAYKLVETAFTAKAEIALEARNNHFQDVRDRAAIFDPIYVDLGKAQSLFETAGLLNSNLRISIESAINWIHNMTINPPTSEQMDQLRQINELFKNNNSTDVIMEEENQIHPDIKRKLQRINLILSASGESTKI